MASCLPKLAVSAVEYVAADGDYAKVLLNYVSKLLLCETLPKRWQLRRHVVLYAVLHQGVAKIHVNVSFFLLSISLD